MKPLSPHELRILHTYADCESVKLTAEELELSVSHVRNALSSAYRKLDTNNILGAAKVMGWLKLKIHV